MKLRLRLRYGYDAPLVRVIAAMAAAFALLLGLTPSARAAGSDLDAARRRANEAAARLSQAQSRLAVLETEIAELERKVAETINLLSGLEQSVREQAIQRFVHGGSTHPLVITEDIGETVRANALARFIATDTTDSIDAYRAAREDLEDSQTALEAKREEAAATVRASREAAVAAQQELARLERIEAERRAREAAAAARSARTRRAGTSAGVSGVIASGSWICPVQGPRAFSNDYGDPRSGGRRHQGIDILSPRGTPVVASVSGFVTHRSVSLGGLSYYLQGSDGITYFGTHLSGYGASGRVAAGTVIGYVGDTGNARGTPHLHFEMHPGGGGAVNPYPTLVKYC